jgi:hypothetical protein
MQPTNDPNSLVLRRTRVRLHRSATSLPEQASWPFTKILIQPGLLSIKLFGTNLSFTPDTVTPLEEYSQTFTYGQRVNEHGLHIVPTSQISAGKIPDPIVSIDVSIRSKDYVNTISTLQSCGFTIVSKTR